MQIIDVGKINNYLIQNLQENGEFSSQSTYD